MGTDPVFPKAGAWIDPYHPHARWFAGEVYRSAGDYQRAITLFRSSPYISPCAQGQIAVGLIVKDQMPETPETVEEWTRLWEQPLSYKYPQDADTLLELELKAGFCG